jgi:hypothetical protein
MQKLQQHPSTINITLCKNELTMVKRNLQFGTNAETLWTAAEATKKVTAATP